MFGLESIQEQSKKEQTENKEKELTRLLPSDCEEYIEKLVEDNLGEAEIEATFQLSAEEEFEDKDNSDSDGEKEKEKDQQSLFKQIKSILTNTESYLQRYMWVIALVWILLSGFNWLIGVRFTTITGTLLTKPPPAPIPFFPNYSRDVITDYYFGNNADPQSLLRKSEVSVLMYYAPWSLHSQEARKPFIDAATSLEFIPTIKFSAVNCNTKYGRCKKSFKLYSYPVIVGYVGTIYIQYNGPRTAQGIFRFARHLLKPMIKIDSIEELEKRSEENKFLIIGYFPVNDRKAYREYTTFLASAYKSGNDFDRFGSAQFIVVSNHELAIKLNLSFTDRIRVYMKDKTWNPIGTSYYILRETTSDDILGWIESRIDQEVESIQDIKMIGPGYLDLNGKSEELYKYLSNSTVGILFTTNYESFAESKSMKALRSVVENYYKCGDNSAMYIGKMTDIDKVVESQNFCKETKLNMSDVILCCHLIKATGMCRAINTSMENVFGESYCSTVAKVYSEVDLKRKCCNHFVDPKSDKLYNFEINWERRLNCEWYRLQKRVSNLALKASNMVDIMDSNDLIKGLSCRNNDTIKFMAIDKKLAKFYINKWKIADDNYFKLDERLRPDIFTIISSKKEEHYVLKESISTESLSGFINDYHQNKLVKVSISESNDKHASKNIHGNGQEDNVIRFETLTANTFNVFLKSKKSHDSIVLFTGGQIHGPSSSILYILHTVAAYFKEFDSQIKFYKIDTSTNNLMYQYSFERVPALVYFRAYQRDSVTYPNNLPVTVPNILAFILSRCQPELKWRIALSSCSAKCIKKNRIKLRRFISNIDRDIRHFRLTKFHESRKPTNGQHTTKMRHYRIAIHRRILQKRAAIHLDNVLNLLESGNVLDNNNREEIIRQSLFVRWLLYNRFGFKY